MSTEREQEWAIAGRVGHAGKAVQRDSQIDGKIQLAAEGRDLKANEAVILGWEWDDGNAIHALPALIEAPHFFSSLWNNRPHQVTHLRTQMTHILHSLTSTFTTCACGSKSKDCALQMMAAFVDGEIPAPTESTYPPHAYQPSYPTSHSYPQKRPGVNGRDSNHPPLQSPYTQTPHFSHPWASNYHNPTPTPTTPFPHSPLVPDSYVQPPHLYRKPHSTTTSTSFRPPSAGPSSSKPRSSTHRPSTDPNAVGPSNPNVDLGPLVGTQRGFRTRERGVEGWSGGMEGVEMVPSRDSEEGSSRDVPEVRVSPATRRRDVKGKEKSVAWRGGRVWGRVKRRRANLAALRRCRHSSRSCSGSVSSLMDEDKVGDDRMDSSDISARIPPKMRKGWIRKTVPVVASGKQSVEGLDKGKIKQKDGTVEIDTEMDGPTSTISTPMPTASTMPPPPSPNLTTAVPSSPYPSLSPAYKPPSATHLHPSDRRSSDPLSYPIFAPSIATPNSNPTTSGPAIAPAPTSATATPSPTTHFVMLSLTSPQICLGSSTTQIVTGTDRPHECYRSMDSRRVLWTWTETETDVELENAGSPQSLSTVEPLRRKESLAGCDSYPEFTHPVVSIHLHDTQFATANSEWSHRIFHPQIPCVARHRSSHLPLVLTVAVHTYQ
ncbi:uncharacterized protein STEHIDRAFT_113147 [Stereum hirsutum FP-91666 SS1]|uniref:uncharacterized protein n=1 Tax=Stereum hirsutum (strain FP-91666) TaxID=721885 RepID=UPI000444A3ED|nr:uncharacterized protein STEHIDRAFT_113147 [Stereum hirsutum FP-91666 SS1]EIM83910.1 hypothetical protein STEHIDRAFT_113147 [Stereum hirsutum FP-91666 SS1]